MFNNKNDIVEQPMVKDRSSKEMTERFKNSDTCSFSSEYDLVDKEYVNDDLSTDALKLQMYEEIVQRFGPDEQFSEMLRTQGTLDRMMSNGEILSTNTSTTSTVDNVHNSEDGVNLPEVGKVEVLLVSQVPEIHRSSFHSLINIP